MASGAGSGDRRVPGFHPLALGIGSAACSTEGTRLCLQAAAEQGDIHPQRLKNYFAILQSLAEQALIIRKIRRCPDCRLPDGSAFSRVMFFCQPFEGFEIIRRLRFLGGRLRGLFQCKFRIVRQRLTILLRLELLSACSFITSTDAAVDQACPGLSLSDGTDDDIPTI
ncbi:MAG: hypothetical protein R3F38_16410 [Gammaproteobacteria bacterium]